MRRRFRTIALAAVGGLLMLAPASTAFATSDLFMPINPPTVTQATPWSEIFRNDMIRRWTLADGLDTTAADSDLLVTLDRTTQTIDSGSRYDGKNIPG